MYACNTTTADQLLSLRDGEPIQAYVVQHVNTCAACSRELARLRSMRSALQALPTLVAPTYAPVLPTVLPTIQPQGNRRFFRATAIAAAASVSAIALLIAVTRLTNHQAVRVTSVTDNTSEPAVASLVIRSQDLEARLQRMPSRPLMERASTTTTIDSLQSSIQWVDYQLSIAHAGISESQAAQLWQDRIQLMDSLVKVRYAETQRFAVLQ